MIPSSPSVPASSLPGLSLPEFLPGWVWLAGAGPGDPGLLTLHAANALAQADTIVYDALVGPEILGLARPGAALEFAGKRGGKPSPRQPDISARLVTLARQGRRVLRLKGGDPFVFGRGGEEALTLVENGIPFRVIPGVTAGIGGLAYAGIPATHRDTNHAVTFLTGHASTGLVPDGLDWAAIARGSPVIVMYMALKHLELIAGRLIEGGRDPAEPVAVVTEASLPTQRVLETTLAACAGEAEAAGLKPPAMVVVGPVVRLRASLDWLGALAGRALVPDALGTRRRGEAV
ncbi:uroporphyrinogen-III C-methyltransferase [Arenibaculum pallidiluteum]|uniref:uroporphyrinogen-III C-methyltransferase n=1 Tax=Arenibaculum pallidiluteum TaxID=2812559 RepID=UPI001A956D10|nr:uroporphyrinogen-III C-methyltransferase [Arenibaculum pallidiluteum]